MRRGAKTKSAALKLVAGTSRADRQTITVVSPVAGDAVRPAWLTAAHRKIWDSKIAHYRARRQNVAGCEDALAQYVALEADLIDRRRKKVEIPVALINAHRIYAAEFYDTPASQHATIGKGAKENPFARNGRKPADA